MSHVSVLVVDDDPSDRRLIQDVLEIEGCRALGAPDGIAALTILQNKSPDLIFLNITLPGIDGFEVLQRIRQFSTIPVIAISGSKALEDRLKFLNLGGDDYVTKPFEVDELRFRAKIALKKYNKNNVPLVEVRFDDGFLEVDFKLRRVATAKKELALPPREYDLLHEFIANIGKTLTHQRLLTTIWGNEYSSDISLLHTCVARLRSKIEPAPFHPRYVITVPRVGYRFQTLS